MTNMQSAKYNSYQAIKVFFATHVREVAGMQALTDAVASFNVQLVDLDAAVGAQDTNTTGPTTAKEAAKAVAVARTISMAASLSAFADATNNHDLEEAADLQKSTLEDMKEDAFSGRLSRIADLAAANPGAVVPAYGQDVNSLADLNAAITAWRSHQGKVQHAIAEGERGTKEIARIIPAIDNLLEDRIDRLVSVLAGANPGFGDEYAAVREINDPPSATRSLDVTVTDGDSVLQGAPLMGVRGVITPGDIQKLSGPTGNFYINTLAPGSYTLELSKPGYATQMTAFDVVAGETQTLTIVMQED